MKNIITIIAILVLGTSVAQTQREKYADKLSSTFAYLEAAKVYAEVAEKQIKKDEIDNKLMLKTARVSYNIRDYKSAAKYFAIANNKEGLKSSDLDEYIDALVRTKNYVAINGLATNASLKDHSGVKLSDVEELHNKSKNSNKYTLQEFEYNSDEGEYAALKHLDGNVFFSTSRKGFGFTHEAYEWDGLNYTNIFKLDTIEKNAQILKEASSEYHDGPLCFSRTNNTAYLTRTEYIKKGKKEVKHIKVFTSSYTNGQFNGWEAFSLNNTEYNVGHVAFNTEGDVMYLVSDMPGGYGGTDLYSSTLVNGEWSSLVNLGARINTPGDEMFPFIDVNNVMYFSTNGNYGYGGLDVYKVLIDSDEKPVNVDGLNSNMDDFAFNLDNESKMGYISSDRKDGVDRIYSVTVNTLNGKLIINPMDLIKNTSINDVTIYVIDRDTKDSVLVEKNNSDEYIANIESGKDYTVVGQKKDYELDAPIYLNTSNLRSGEKINKDLFLNQTHYDLKVKTVVKGSNEICPNVEGEFTDPVSGEVVSYKTDSNGEVMLNIENNHTYAVTARKKGFLDLHDVVHTDAGVLIELDLKMQEIKKDVKFEIENILYDLAKWDLREESKAELDKLVGFLTINDNIKVELSAHTDSRATRSYNQKLSQKRAQSCVTYLIEKGISKNRIVAKGYGESQLINKCKDGVTCSEEEHQANRRTEIKILSVTK